MSSGSETTFSLFRVLLVAIPVAALGGFLAKTYTDSMVVDQQTELERNVLSGMLVQIDRATPDTDFKFVDSDADLVADAPSDAAEFQQPEALVFSYIAEELGEGEEPALDNWGDLTEALAEATGLPVTAKHYTKVADQLAALRTGEVHLIGLSTGAAPLAVEGSGFQPLCTMAHSDGSVGYKMVVIAGADSEFAGLDDLTKKRPNIIFVRPTSNSGFKAAFVQLHEDAGLLPERDYDWSFSLSHDASIKAVVEGKADVAPVASDLLTKMVERGEISAEDYQVIYESESFPPAVLGCAHNLPVELVEKLKQSLVDFSWAGTGLEKELGPMEASAFVPVNYKDDWANIRRIDSTVVRIIDSF